MKTLTKQIAVRLTPTDYRLLKEISKARGIDISDFIRQAIRSEFAKLSYLDASTKKALGIMEGGTK
jgi:uncharacterized protein (DUF1778 family)